MHEFGQRLFVMVLKILRVEVCGLLADDVLCQIEHEVAEQTTIAEILKSMGATPAKLTDKQSQMIAKAKEAKSGPSFDEDFLAGQLDGHRELLKIQETLYRQGQG